MKTVIVSALVALALSAAAFAAEAPVSAPVRVRIGWQVPWATQGQLVQILKHTDILKRHHLEGEFIGRTYGPMLNELALAGSVDAILTADQPAAALFSKDKGWSGIGRLMYNRTLTYSAPKSDIREMKDLRGRTIGVPIGAAAERVTDEALAKAGLDPAKDVKIINLDIKEQGPLVLKGGKEAKSWGNIDALSGFDPTPAIFEARGLIHVLDVGKVVSLVVMNDAFAKAHPDAPVALVDALKDAYDYYRLHREEANRWFMAEAHLDGADQKACDLAASIEPNLEAKDRAGIRMSFTDDDFALMQKGADFIEPKIKRKVDMRKYVTNQYAKATDGSSPPMGERKR